VKVRGKLIFPGAVVGGGGLACLGRPNERRLKEEKEGLTAAAAAGRDERKRNSPKWSFDRPQGNPLI